MKIVKINGADIYVDGGSYGFWFDCEDGNEYELFIKRDLSKDSKNDYYPPVIYRNGYNRNSVVKKLGWTEAQDYLSNVNYTNIHFKTLVEIVKNDGNYIP